MRDRLADLIAICRNEGSDDAFGVQPDPFMKEFFKQVEDTRRLIGRIYSQVEEVKSKQSYVLSAPVPDERTKNELALLNEEIKGNINSVQSSLKGIQVGLSQDESAVSVSVNLRIQKSQLSALSCHFREVMTLYNEAQVSFREKSKAQIQRQLEITGRVTSSEQLDVMLESGRPTIFVSTVLSDCEITREALSEIESRHKDIVQLESSIRELHQMFLDIALLLETQGDMANNIEKNVHSAAEYVGRAERETKKAVEYQSRTRRLKLLPSFPSLFRSAEPSS